MSTSIFFVNSILAYMELLANNKLIHTSSASESNDEEKICDEVAAKQNKHSGSEGPSNQHRQDDVVNDFCDIPTKLALANRLKEVNKRKSATHKAAIKTLDWSEIQFDNIAEEELKECLKQMLSSVCTIRTLGEMLNDYLTNYRRYELKANKEDDPLTAFKLYYQDKKANDPSLKFQEIHRMYKNLSDIEKLKYINKLISLDTHLEKAYTAAEKKVMLKSSGMPLRPVSSYNSFVKEMNLGSKKFSMKEVSALWKNLSLQEKKFKKIKPKKMLRNGRKK
jgi:hypothetical protein